MTLISEKRAILGFGKFTYALEAPGKRQSQIVANHSVKPLLHENFLGAIHASISFADSMMAQQSPHSRAPALLIASL